MHDRFKYKTGQDLILRGKELGVEIPFSEDLSPLFAPSIINGYTIPNRFAVQPMEGYDSAHDGSPSPLTRRRYLRYAEGGSGIIWFEATAVSLNGRSNPGQLIITDSNIESYRALVSETRKAAGKCGFNPLLVVQLTHSGRYSKPEGKPQPQVMTINPLLDKIEPYILTDRDLKHIQDQYIASAKLAMKAGFDLIDVKACHGYLVIESLAAKGRGNSVYGGIDPAYRFRFMLETIDRLRNEVPGITITTRLNISDCYRNGFGVDSSDQPDFTEPLLLVEELLKRDIRLINISMGSPYFNPHITRPFDTPVPGSPVPDEHPLKGVMRIIDGTSLFQKRFPEISFVGSAYSYLRQFAPNVGAAIIKNAGASFIGFGRNSFAYPSMPADIMKNGKVDPAKFCITCSGCTRLISNLRHGGCVIRDKEIYGTELKKLIADEK
jgi:2,4-dienoyl-CoA reductase-like NADH-dependent reductase (Old Yellow Enzyme family)